VGSWRTTACRTRLHDQGKIVEIAAIADPARLRKLDLTVIDD